MRIKVARERNRHGLCGSCRNAHIVDFDNGTYEIFCAERAYGNRPIIRRPVVHCTDHMDKARATQHEMEQLAWVVRTDKSGKVLGFRPPEKKKND